MPDHHEQIIRLIEEAEREAYERGRRDAIAAIMAAASAQPAPDPLPPANDVATQSKPRGRPATIINSVTGMIGKKPGLTGAEIVRALAADGTPVLDRSMRSCLRRLKASGEVWQRNKRWYPKSKAKPEMALNEIGEVPGTPPH